MLTMLYKRIASPLINHKLVNGEFLAIAGNELFAQSICASPLRLPWEYMYTIISELLSAPVSIWDCQAFELNLLITVAILMPVTVRTFYNYNLLLQFNISLFRKQAFIYNPYGKSN